jgi:threonine/homoserine/homoserine lactone efflux protein
MMMPAHYLLGILLGAGSSVIPGPCGLAVLDAATRINLRRAVATAIGAGLGDLTYAALGMFAVGHLLSADSELAAGLLAIGGVVLIAFGLACMRHRPVPRAVAVRSVGGMLVGFAALVTNPGVLVTWSAVGASLVDAPTAEQASTVVGIGSGSLAWFIITAHLYARGIRVLAPHMRRIVQLVGLSIVAYGALSIARAVL